MAYIGNFLNMIIKILIWILMIILVYSLVEYVLILINILSEKFILKDFMKSKDKKDLFLSFVQPLIGGVLMFTILIELIKSLVEFLSQKSSNYLLVLYEIALIALVRHFLIIDIEHSNSGILFGGAALLLVIFLSYYLLLLVQAKKK